MDVVVELPAVLTAVFANLARVWVGAGREDPRLAEVIASPAVPRFQWNNGAGWIDFDEESQEQLQAAHQRQENEVAEVVVLRIGHYTYHISLGDMSQTNQQTGHRRAIRIANQTPEPVEAAAQVDVPLGETVRVRGEEQMALDEEVRVEQLGAFTGLPREECAAALRRYDGDVERAATALLQARAEDY